MLYVCTKLKSSPHALSKMEPPEGCNCIQPAYLIFPDTPSSLHTIAGKLQIWSSFVLSSVQFIHSVMSNSLQLHGLQHARHPCPSPTPRAYSDSCPLSRWCHPTSHPLLFPSPPTFNLPQHQGLFQWVSYSHQVAKGLEFQLQHQSFQWIFRVDIL